MTKTTKSGVPACRPGRRRKEQPDVHQGLSIEQHIREYRIMSRFDREAAESHLEAIQDAVKPLLASRGIRWDTAAEAFLMDAVKNYDLLSEIKFFAFFVDALERVTRRKAVSDAEILTAEAYQGTGDRTFQRTFTSNPERITLDHNRKIMRRFSNEENSQEP